MKCFQFRSLAIITALGLVTVSGAVSAEEMMNAQVTNASMLAVCSGIQKVDITNQLANTNLPDSGMTKSDVTLYLYSGGQQCWSDTIAYGNQKRFQAGPGCGCKTPIDRIDIVVARNGDPRGVYANQTVIIPKQDVQISLFQDPAQPAPVFDQQSGLVSKQGTIIKAGVQVTSAHQ